MRSKLCLLRFYKLRAISVFWMQCCSMNNQNSFNKNLVIDFEMFYLEPKKIVTCDLIKLLENANSATKINLQCQLEHYELEHSREQFRLSQQFPVAQFPLVDSESIHKNV